MERYVAGVDVGGTTIKMGLFTETERVALWEVKSPSRSEVEHLYEVIRDALYAKMDELAIPREALKAVGMGLPGPVSADGHIPWLVNLGLGASYPGKELETLMGIPCVAGNDANMAALGEAVYGAAKGAKSAVMVTLGTGVGGGIVVDGKIIAGFHGVGGELGHIVVNPDETAACNCGNRGCLEQYASATGIVRSARKLLREEKMPSVLTDDDSLTCKTVMEAAKAGDPVGLKALDIFGRYLGLMLSYVVLTIDPEKIIIGGGVSKAGDILVDAVNQYIDRYTHIAENRGEVILATLGNEAGTAGAAKIAWDACREAGEA